jgi:hypothetical protein
MLFRFTGKKELGLIPHVFDMAKPATKKKGNYIDVCRYIAC